MATARLTLGALLLGWMLSPFCASASDIDIYSGLTNATGAPNLLLVIDNAADFTSNYAGATPCGYVDSSATPGLNGKNGSVEQCALNNVIYTLPVNADGSARVNVGIMVYNSSSLAKTFTNCNGSGNGGCLVYPITPMTATNKSNLLTFIKSWTAANIGTNNEATAATMQEAWAYLAGQTGMSGTVYTSPVSASGCQSNYVVFIANALTTNGSPGDASSSPGTTLNTVVTTRVNPSTNAVALNSAQQAIYSPAFIQLPSGAYGINGVITCSPNPYVMKSSDHTQVSGLYADEWALYMFGTDLFTGAMPENKNIITYSIGVLSSSCMAGYPALLTSMAKNGGGKYYAVQNANDLANALNSIFNEVQAVNSVFSSATLPVSVNAQGTYLNQLYMGMFRPDPNALPRWVGNVKQYQFALDQNKNLYLADATGQPALSSSGTGFISTQAASFWSCTNSTQAGKLSGPPAPYTLYSSLPTCAADPTIGYWINNFNYATFSAGKAFDLMDGEIVEKGGASQQLRLENLNDDYTTTAGTSTNPRRLYTLCPAGTANCPCSNAGSKTTTINNNTVCASLNDPMNAFAANNTNISGSSFGGSSTVVVTSLTQSGGTVTATTAVPHGWSNGASITISGATPTAYNGTFAITNVSSTSFTYQIQENPPLSAALVPPSNTSTYYQVQAHQTGYTASSVTRTFTSNANPSPNANQETATIVTTVANNFGNGGSVIVSGGNTNENAYNGQKTISVVNSTTFTYPVAITPPTPATNTYTVALHSTAPITISTISLSGSTATVTTATAHGFNTNDYIQISSTTNTCFNTVGATITVTGSTTFTYSGVTGCGSNKTSTGGSATPVAPSETIASLTRTGTTNTATATATLNVSRFATNDLVDITSTGGATNEWRYLGTYTINCTTTACTTFTYPISVGPIYPATSTFTVTAVATPVSITALTRSTTTATAQLASVLPQFTSGNQIDVFAAPGTTPPSAENAYQGTFTATCGSTCQTLSYGPITLTPASPASGNIIATNPTQAPNATTLINWVRGQDNMGDEASMCPPGSTAGSGNCPKPAVTVRPSVHGDALHSRPIAVNYGGTTGVVVYYGTNDGVYHAINGNQSSSIGTVAPGDELWGVIMPDFYPKLERQRANSPQILMPGTPSGIIPTPQPKDYFIDGPTGLLQEIDGNLNTVRAIIYIGARRGGHILYAIDVTNPLTPYVLWKIDNSSTNMAELGETWSLPKVARVAGYTDASGNPIPVIIMGGGYDDGSEDAEPPVSAMPNGGGVDTGSDNTGRAVFVLDAFTGNTIWQMNHYNTTATAWPQWWTRAQNGTQGGVCSGTPPAPVDCEVYGMNYSIPADVTLVDKNNDGLIDRLYATDVGGNVWRVDLEPNAGKTPDKWVITNLAALGCAGGPCDTTLMATSPYPSAQNPAPTQRKFFFPAEIIGATTLANYDAVFVGSGDREHPLQSQQAYNVTNRMYMIKDVNTGNDSSGQQYPITENGYWGTGTSLDDCTGGTCTTATTGATTAMPYCQLTVAQQNSGYYFTLDTGEKVVNAPIAVAGYVYFGTNQPAPASTTSTCTTNLGIARGYQLSPYCASYARVIYAGGGLPPSPVAGVVNITTPSGTVAQPFCVGCPSPLTGTNNCSNSALAACKPTINVPAIRHRNYWYMDNR